MPEEISPGTAQTPTEPVEPQTEEAQGVPLVEDAEKPAEGEAQEGQEPQEGEEAPAEGEKPADGEAKPPVVPDDHVFDLDGEEVTFEELKDTYKFVSEGYTQIKEAETALKNVDALRNALQATPADAITFLFAQEFGGDLEKGRQKLVGLAEKILQAHLEFETLSEPEKKAATAEREAAELRRQLAERDQQAQQTVAEQEEAALAAEYSQSITVALKKASLEPDEDMIADSRLQTAPYGAF
jgi:hypothetical protein